MTRLCQTVHVFSLRDAGLTRLSFLHRYVSPVVCTECTFTFLIFRLVQIHTLDVSGNALTRLDGLQCLPCLETLIADRNCIRSLDEELMCLNRLRVLSVADNRLFWLMHFLSYVAHTIYW